MNNDLQQQQVMGALGYPVALPQTVKPVTNTKTTIQRTQYDPEKLLALKTALATPRKAMSQDEIWANALANYPEAKSYTGGFGEEIISPWGEGLSNFARSFGSAYAAQKADEREKAEQAREDAIKAAQIALDADKQVIDDETATEHIKFNDPNAKNEQEQALAQQKLAQTAYVKLNPNLAKDIRENKDAFGYVAREADIGGRTPAGGTTGMAERLVASVMKSRLGEKNTAARGRLNQEMAQYVGAVTDMARQGGATGAMMNSDKEGQRALQIMSNPAAYDAETLASAAEVIVDLYNRMLAVKGMPSVQEGYNQVTQMIESQKPQTNIWDKYKTK